MFVIVDGTKGIYPVTQKIDASLKPELSYHGEVKMSAGTIISKAVATLKKFGSYFKFRNNCQDFCNYYLESIDLGEIKKLTDSEKIDKRSVLRRQSRDTNRNIKRSVYCQYE